MMNLWKKPQSTTAYIGACRWWPEKQEGPSAGCTSTCPSSSSISSKRLTSSNVPSRIYGQGHAKSFQTEEPLQVSEESDKWQKSSRQHSLAFLTTAAGLPLWSALITCAVSLIAHTSRTWELLFSVLFFCPSLVWKPLGKQILWTKVWTVRCEKDT